RPWSESGRTSPTSVQSRKRFPCLTTTGWTNRGRTEGRPWCRTRSRPSSARSRVGSTPMPRSGGRPLRADQRQAGLRVVALLEVPRRLGDNYFERRPDPPVDQVPTQGPSVPLADDHVGVDARLAFVEDDVADEREHLDLLADRDLQVLLLLAIEVAQRHL